VTFKSTLLNVVQNDFESISKDSLEFTEEEIEGKDKEDSPRATPTVLQRPRGEQGASEDSQVRRREVLRRQESGSAAGPEESGADGRESAGRARAPQTTPSSQGGPRRVEIASRGGRQNSGETPDESSRHERAPWFDPNIGDQSGELRRTSTGRSQASSTGDRSDRGKASAESGEASTGSRWHAEPDRAKAPASVTTSSSSAAPPDRRDGVRLRRQPDDSEAAGEEGERERRPLGDKGPDGRTPLSRVANTATARFTPAGGVAQALASQRQPRTLQ